MVYERSNLEGEKWLLLVRSYPDDTHTPILIDSMDPFIPQCSCFNAFSRVDVRVDVKIPGGVNAYVVDLRGERYVFLI